MFERYSQNARRLIFFSHYEAVQAEPSHVEPEHLLLGLLREDKRLAGELLHSLVSIREKIKGRLSAHAKHPPSDDVPLGLESNGTAHTFLDRLRKALPRVHLHLKRPLSREVPISLDSKRVLANAAVEAESRGQLVDITHIFLGLLHDEKSFATALLHEHGLNLSSVTDELERSNVLPAHNGEWQPLDFVLKAVNPKLAKGVAAKPGYYHDGSGDRTRARRVRCENTTMAEFAENLPLIAPEYICGGTVVNATGLDGAWNFTLNFGPAMARSAPGTLTLFEALEDQLGLRLEESA